CTCTTRSSPAGPPALMLRVFHFSSMLLQGMMRSYFGGLLCVCWSPDGRYVVTGGEDDLVTVWSFDPPSVTYRFGS
uniref:Uncharacterized protein n=1 Tax=Serinus canaria TaxID=9135 RepID=A0A8C9L0K6_SERCA